MIQLNKYNNIRIKKKIKKIKYIIYYYKIKIIINLLIINNYKLENQNKIS